MKRSLDVYDELDASANARHLKAHGCPDNAVLCECVDARKGTISTAGGFKPVFIMELRAEGLKLPLIKYFNVRLTPAGSYAIPHNGDFAKLYRLTIGDSPRKRFSEAQKLLKHFLGHSFNVEYEYSFQRKGESYFKVTHIEPVNPLMSEAWTETGMMIKVFKSRTNRGQVEDKLGIFRGQVADNKSLQGAKTLGLQPFSIPQKHFPQEHRHTDTLPSFPDAMEEKTPKPESRHFIYEQRPGETKDEYWDRVIDESLPDWRDDFVKTEESDLPDIHPRGKPAGNTTGINETGRVRNQTVDDWLADYGEQNDEEGF